MPPRRAFLLGMAVALAGCAAGGQSNESPTNGSPTASPTSGTTGSTEPTVVGETAEVGDLDVRVHDPEARYSYFRLPFPDFASVATPEMGQFVFVSVDVRGGSDLDVPEIEAFSVAVGEQTFQAHTEGVSPPLDQGGPPYSRARREGLVRFDLPAPVGDGEVGFQLDDGEGEPVEWRFGPELVTRLRQPPPEFELRDFQAPEEVGPDEPIEVSAEVENVGDGPGTFRAALNQEGEIVYGGSTTTFEMEVGEEHTWSETVDTHVGRVQDEPVTVHLRFRSAGGDEDRDVRVRPTS